MDRVLARFRADPKRVHIAIRKLPDGGYIVRLTAGQTSIWRAHRRPTAALALALRAAEGLKLPGIDLSMGWAYEHPWGGLGGLGRRT